MYPFSAIVGQTELKQALLVIAVNPEIGGLLISGDKGTAKSTAVRAIADLLPKIEVRRDCRFNCEPDDSSNSCHDCIKLETAETILKASPFVNLPLGSTEDRLIGSLDFEKALKTGSKVFQPGLLAGANRGVLYIDEVNLLPDHLVDMLLDVAASGVNTVERESMTLIHASRFTLVGSMNPEEGELRPQFLDRFAMMVELRAPEEPCERAEIVRRRFEFDSNQKQFARAFEREQNNLRLLIETARSILPAVELSEDQLENIAAICSRLGVRSMRADIFMHRVARTLAAIAGRMQVNNEDLRRAASLVLIHRYKRRQENNVSQESRNELEKTLDNVVLPDTADDCDQDSDNLDAEDRVEKQIFAPTEKQEIKKIETSGRNSNAYGRRAMTSDRNRGAYISTSMGRTGSVAVDATIRHSVIRNEGRLMVEAEDYHSKIRASKRGNLIVIVVDASGSMANMQKISEVKGAVIRLLQDAYQRRDQVAVISFRGKEAELILAPSKSVSFAFERMENLVSGGTTPIARGLELALKTIGTQRPDSPEPLIVLLTDGRANSDNGEDTDPWTDALQSASEIAKRSIPSLVLDSETGFVRLGRAKALADALGGEYMPLDEVTADSLKLLISNKLGVRRN